MGFRFRRSIRLAPGFRLNLGRRGASFSVGGHGFTENVGRHGARTTLGIPGTGISYSARIGQRRRHRHASILGTLAALAVLFILACALFG